MRKMSFRTRLWLLILLTALLIGLTTFAVGKYITTVSVKSSVTFTATLAEKVLLQEHKAVRQTDGSYQLDDTSIVQANTYTLIPGLDVPKDPHIVITGKTEIPAYLYIEVVDSTSNGALSYNLDTCWKESTKITATHSGKIYVYSNGTDPIKITSAQEKISILQEDKFCVSQELLSSDTNDSLVFYAYLVEATD